MKTGNGLCIAHLLFFLIFWIKTGDKKSCTRAEIVLLHIHLVTSVFPEKLTCCFKYKSFPNFLFKTKTNKEQDAQRNSVTAFSFPSQLELLWKMHIPSQLGAPLKLEDFFNLVRKVGWCSLGFSVGFSLDKWLTQFDLWKN